MTFHWPNTLCPESQWALPHYRSALPALRDAVTAAGGELIGHGHPRAWRQFRREWGHLGIRPVESLARIFDEADVLAVDNSSAGWEAMSMGIPVVWLDAPWYRRDVDHGLRFWEHADSGVRIGSPDDLVEATFLALSDPSEVRARREAAVRAVYTYTDGHAADRAAASILAVTGSVPEVPSRP